MARDHSAGGQVEPRAARLGELLRSWLSHQSVSGARQLHSRAVAPVVALQVQGQATQGRDLSTLAPLRALRSRTPDRACRPREDIFLPKQNALSPSSVQATAGTAVLSLLQRNSLPSTHIRCRTTARRLATATMARRTPRR